MTNRAVMQQALEALEALERYSGVDQRACDAEDALRQAIEQAEKQEPKCVVILEVFGKDWRLDYMSLPVGKHKLYTQQYVYTTPPAAQQEPTPWRDMIVASLVREGIDKHRARELADHFAAQPEQEPCIGKDPRCPCQDGDACHYKDCGDTKALPVPVAQRPWVGLTPEEVLDLFDLNNVYGSKWVEFAKTVEDKLKERNT